MTDHIKYVNKFNSKILFNLQKGYYNNYYISILHAAAFYYFIK